MSSSLDVKKHSVLQAIMKHGGLVKPALAELGFTYTGQYRRWVEGDPEFAARVRSAKAAVKGGRFGSAPGKPFEVFRKEFFGRDTYPHQSQLAQILDTVKPREIVLVLIHPEAGKTATIEDWLCQRIGENPDLRVTYLGESSDLAKKVLGYIKGRMTEPEFVVYQTAYGPFYIQGQEKEGKPWTSSYITVQRSTHAERDYTIQCRAITSRAYGSRIDLLIGDDIQSRETYTQTDKIFAHLRQTYFTRGKQMTMVFVGTRIGPGDIYEKMIEANLIDRLITLPAAVGTTPKVPEAWADPDDYEEREDFLEAAEENLARIRHQVGEDVWWASYQQLPRSNELASFTTDLIDNAKDHDRNIAPPNGGQYTVFGLDPALGGQNALLAAVYHPDRLELVDLQTDEGFSQTEQIVNRIAGFATEYHPTELIVEKNAFQRALANDFRLAQVARQHGFRIRHHETGTNKTDPVLGVAAMAGAFIANEIRIPYGNEHARTRFKPLLDQLETWRPNIPTKLIKQDAVMALWFVWKNWQEWRTVARQHIRPQRRPSWLRDFVGARY